MIFNLFINKIFFLILIASVSYLTFGYLYNNYSPNAISISNNSNSILFNLSDKDYLQISSTNDLLDNGNNFTTKPFKEVFKKNFQILGINIWPLSTMYLQKLEDNDNKREIQIIKNNNNNFLIKLKVVTNYKPSSNLKYYFLIDYSEETDFKDNKERFSFLTKNCFVSIDKDPTLLIKDFGNKKSLEIISDYQENLEISLKMNIQCN